MTVIMMTVMPEEGFSSITVPDETKEKARNFYNEHREELKQLGIRTFPQFLDKAVSDFMDRYKTRFRHINTYEDHALIADFERRDFITIIFREGGTAWCDADKTDSCVHIDFALTVPSIIEKLKEKGWRSNGKVL